MQNKIAYFGISKSNRINFDPEVEAIKVCLEKHDIILNVFVDKYEFTAQEENEMMRVAFSEIDNCDFLIVELSKKAIGVGVEVGYAKAKNKPIIYIKRKGEKHSTTVAGSADYSIEYEDVNYLQMELNKAIKQLIR